MSNNKTFNKQVDTAESYVYDNLQKLQRELYVMLLADSFSVKEWITKFKEYEKEHKRFFYSYITQYIFDEEKDEKIEQLLGRMGIILDQAYMSTFEHNNNTHDEDNTHSESFSDENIKVSYDQYLMILKLYDHCNLASQQRLAYKNKATQKDIENRIEETKTIIK